MLWAGLQLLQHLGFKIIDRGAMDMIHRIGKAEISSEHGRVHTISRQKSLCFENVVEKPSMYQLNLLLSLPKVVINLTFLLAAFCVTNVCATQKVNDMSVFPLSVSTQP